jgi:hypothetical protein
MMYCKHIKKDIDPDVYCYKECPYPTPKHEKNCQAGNIVEKKKVREAVK